ncbi:MAG TPA: substrate-binding domain-containing protein [Verrucomicrobiae bacterium]|nr:substrate-binding domain-containing protein [Verrucomicrobiae bacterium]
MKANQSAALGLAYVALLAQTGCIQNNRSAPESKKPRLVFITTGTNSFWQDAASGIEAGASNFQAEIEILTTSPDAIDQEADGIAFAPLYGVVQLVASRGKSCFIGLDQYKAGRKAGALARDLLPEGGKLLIICQRPDSATLQERRQGIVDELLEPDFLVIDATGKHAISEHRDAALIIALSTRDLTGCLDALCAIDKLGHVKLIALEEDAVSREALTAGHVSGIITAQPYEYGYHAVRVLAALARGDLSVLPKSGFLDLPLVVLDSETASHTAGRGLHSLHDSTLFPRANAGDLDRATQAGNLAAD